MPKLFHSKWSSSPSSSLSRVTLPLLSCLPLLQFIQNLFHFQNSSLIVVVQATTSLHCFGQIWIQELAEIDFLSFCHFTRRSVHWRFPYWTAQRHSPFPATGRRQYLPRPASRFTTGDVCPDGGRSCSWNRERRRWRRNNVLFWAHVIPTLQALSLTFPPNRPSTSSTTFHELHHHHLLLLLLWRRTTSFTHISVIVSSALVTSSLSTSSTCQAPRKRLTCTLFLTLLHSFDSSGFCTCTFNCLFCFYFHRLQLDSGSKHQSSSQPGQIIIVIEHSRRWWSYCSGSCNHWNRCA